VAAGYQTALASQTEESWRTFVERCRSLTLHCDQVEAAVGFSDRERGAWKFFAQIVDENRDLLNLTVHTAA